MVWWQSCVVAARVRRGGGKGGRRLFGWVGGGETVVNVGRRAPAPIAGVVGFWNVRREGAGI